MEGGKKYKGAALQASDSCSLTVSETQKNHGIILVGDVRPITFRHGPIDTVPDTRKLEQRRLGYFFTISDHQQLARTSFPLVLIGD
jgi:hypothetical protein